MLKTLIFLTILTYTLPTTAQLIKGRVLDLKTDKPIGHVSIYFDGMYKGVISDDEGYFQLPISGSGKTPIIVSAVGYYSASIINYSPEPVFKVYLKPKVYHLNPVSIVYDGMSRQDKEAIFKKEFIGTSLNSLTCEILNLDDIDLIYNQKTKTLEAYSENAIRIHNKALGYKITYFLEKFTRTGDEVYFSGNYFFEEDTVTNNSERRKIIKRREQAYLGSRMHFIRSLWSNRLDREGYRIYNNKSALLNTDSILVTKDSTKHIQIKDRITVYYDGQRSVLKNTKNMIFIDRNGFYDPLGISWSGNISNQRIGDCLPFEYHQHRGL